MWKAERMRRKRRKHNTDTDGTKRDGEGPNSRKECDRRAENGREQTETDGDGRRMFENKFYVTACKRTSPINRTRNSGKLLGNGRVKQRRTRTACTGSHSSWQYKRTMFKNISCTYVFKLHSLLRIIGNTNRCTFNLVTLFFSVLCFFSFLF